MFNLYYDTDLKRLADRLADLLVQRDAADLLRPQTVLVPQPGLQRWLVQHLAEKHGIAANLEFLMPAQMVWRVLRALHPALPERSAFDADLMRWRLFELLQGAIGATPEIRPWIDRKPRELQRFQLAARLAQVYQRYQGYRRELLLGWERGADPGDPQAILWRALTTSSDERPRSHLLGEFLRSEGDGANGPLPGIAARVFAFGCINVSPDVLRFLGVLGRHGELHFFAPTPCGEYWGDIRTRREERAALGERGGGYFDDPDNPLLVSMGAVGREFVAQVFGYDEVMPDEENLADAAGPRTDSLLHRVQADVIRLRAPEPFTEVPDPHDRSLSVHACHSPLREVQVLHDELLDMFEQDATLEPRDIAVMVPDLATYASCVDAVFGALPTDDARRIPWTVADRAASGTHAIVGLLLHLLDLPTMRLTLDEVFEVLEVPAVGRARDIDGTELAAVHAQLAAAGVRWGEDERDREAAGLPATREYSWAFGRDRLLAGYLLGDEGDDEAALVDGIAPMTDIEGRTAQVLGEVLRIQRGLRQLRADEAVAREATAWQSLLNQAFDTLVPEAFDRDEERAVEAVREALAVLADDAAAAHCNVPLDWRAVRDFLGERLAAPPGYPRFLAGGVSVCGMIPLRNVPFRVICVLGLNAHDFPRQDIGDALDRIHAELLADRRHVGDRSVREDDRYLFLQILMAAGERLYLGYTGMDARKGTDLEPSVVLAELLETVCTGYFRKPGQAREALFVRHPLQPFSPRLFDGADARLFTYRHEWQASTNTDTVGDAVEPFVDIKLAAPEASTQRLSLSELARWLARPQQVFLQRGAGIALSEPDVATDEREPLTSDRLLQSRARQALFETLDTVPMPDADAVWRDLRARALLPPLELGRAQFDAYWNELEPQASQWAALAAGGIQPGEPFELHLAGDVILQGRLPDATMDGKVAGWIGGEASAERWIRWWVALLARQADRGATEGFAFGESGKDLTFPWHLKLPEPAVAKAHLAELVDLYRQGLRAPAPFTARTAWSFVQAWNGEAEDMASMRDKALAGAREQWRRTVERDAWVALAMRGLDPLPEGGDSTAFEYQAQAVFVPLWQAVREGGAT